MAPHDCAADVAFIKLQIFGFTLFFMGSYV